jgi:hypothetical protein
MAEFKEGDTIRQKEYCSDVEEGEICVLHYGSKTGNDRNLLFAWGKRTNANCSCSHNWELISHRKEEKMEKMKFGVKFEESSDPVEFFETQKEAEERINELLDKPEVNKSEVYLFEVGRTWKVKRPVTFELVEVGEKKGRGRPKK